MASRTVPAPRRAAAALALLLLLAAAVAGASRAGGGDRAGRGVTTPGGEPVVIGHRGVRRLPPRAHARELHAGRAHGRRLHRARPRLDEGPQLVARHEPEISATTDVADHPEFAARRTTKVIDGVPTTGWFTDDFTLAELKTLRAKERIPAVRQRNTLYDGRYPIPTFQEVIDLSGACRASCTGRSASTRRRSTRRGSARRGSARGAARPGAAGQRPRPPRLARLRPVLRDGEPPAAAPARAGATRPALRRGGAKPTTSRPRAARRPTATSAPPRACAPWPPTRTASARRRST